MFTFNLINIHTLKFEHKYLKLFSHAALAIIGQTIFYIPSLFTWTHWIRMCPMCKTLAGYLMYISIQLNMH